MHEIYRGTYTKFSGGQQDCVRRRAIKSLNMNPNCKVALLMLHVVTAALTARVLAGLRIIAAARSISRFKLSYWYAYCIKKAISEKAVNEVFEKCFHDELPFKTGKPVVFDKNQK